MNAPIRFVIGQASDLPCVFGSLYKGGIEECPPETSERGYPTPEVDLWEVRDSRISPMIWVPGDTGK